MAGIAATMKEQVSGEVLPCAGVGQGLRGQALPLPRMDCQGRVPFIHGLSEAAAAASIALNLGFVCCSDHGPPV